MSEEAPDIELDEEDKVSGSGRMSSADFAEARELYELGKASLGELADTYGVSRQALSKRFKAAGAVKDSRKDEIAAVAGAAAKSASAATAAAIAERFTDRRADWIEETRIQGYQALKSVKILAHKTLMDAHRSGVSVSTVDEDMKTFARLNKILVDNIAASLDLLQAHEHVDEEDLPTLIIEDLTDDEILRHHISTGALPEDTTIEEMLGEVNTTMDLE
jgi:hypothetical protein